MIAQTCPHWHGITPNYRAFFANDFLARIQNPLVNQPPYSSNYYLNLSKPLIFLHLQAEEIPNIKIFHFCGSINFASRDTFKNELCSTLGMDLAKELKRCSKLSNQHVEYDSTHLGFKCLILDFSALSYIDPSGVSSLKSIINEFHKLSAVVYVAGCSCKYIYINSSIRSSRASLKVMEYLRIILTCMKQFQTYSENWGSHVNINYFSVMIFHNPFNCYLQVLSTK